MRPLGAATAALMLLLAAAAPATAHVDVLPREVAQGEAVEFTIRVPTERDLATTAVEVEFPPQVTVFAFAEPPPGWRMRPLRAGDGRFRGVRYTGGRIGVGRYADFRVLGTPFESGAATWPARQTYADGLVKPWTGPPDAGGAPSAETGPEDPGPAAAIEIAAPGEGVGVAAASADDDGSGAAIWLGVIAIGISALAALGVGLLWSTRPARLPEEK